MMPCLKTLQAQRIKSDKCSPQWRKKMPSKTNETFSYVIGSANAGDLNSARSLSVSDMLDHIPKREKIQQIEGVQQRVTDIRGEQNKPLNYNNSTVYARRVLIEGEKVDLHYRVVDEYWEQKRIGGRLLYNLNVLYQVETPGRNARFDEVEVTSMYGVRGLWRSIFVPGWGQLYKGSKTKGGLIMGGVVALAGGILVTENLRSSYTKKIGETRDIHKIRTYADKADNMENARNICIGGAIALYVYNLIDVIVAPGAKRIKMASSLAPDYYRASLTFNF
ncbi:DUF5683 domain-containing protein [Odoribacter sp. OttesenSCG-928-J03]|nr:DUF5683 domain-containing protein [Odoribacter sp. OttesenSCG-928-J03]